MRPHIEHLDTNAMAWNSPRPGTSAKVLSLNTGAPSSTVLLCFDPSEGYEDQPSPHYHEGIEELFILSGQLSFDSRTWFHRGGYIFHPPMTIHGFASSIPKRTTLLARTTGPVASTFIDTADAVDDYPYFIGDQPHPRALALIPSPWAFPFERGQARKGNIKQFIYSREDKTGEVTRLLHFAAGAKEAPPPSVEDGLAEEIFVLSGRLETEDGQVFGEGGFACFPAGKRRPALTAREEAEVLHTVLLD